MNLGGGLAGLPSGGALPAPAGSPPNPAAGAAGWLAGWVCGRASAVGRGLAAPLWLASSALAGGCGRACLVGRGLVCWSADLLLPFAPWSAQKVRCRSAAPQPFTPPPSPAVLAPSKSLWALSHSGAAFTPAACSRRPRPSQPASQQPNPAAGRAACWGWVPPTAGQPSQLSSLNCIV